jgi:glucose-6-phosphate isomerase
MKMGLRLDDANMWQKTIGKSGASSAAWKPMVKRLSDAKKAVQHLARTKEQGFLDLPFDRKAHDAAVALARTMSKQFTDLVVLGIGGSDLGARAIQHALVDMGRKRGSGMNVHFAGSFMDPDELARLLHRLNLKRTCVNIVSKSGGTIEPMSTFQLFRDRIQKVVGAKNVKDHIVVTTDPSRGMLRDMARREGYATLPIPSNVGGRYSVLSAVGLFPAAAMGVDTVVLLSGGRAAVDAFRKEAVDRSDVCRFAGLHVLGAVSHKQRIQVTVPYTPRLFEFGRWVQQLVAESLGKKQTRSGKTVHTGFTPIAAVGPEDQHSQLQLWSEGPADKLITFIEVDRFAKDLVIPGDSTFGKMDHRERAATAEALRRVGRPNQTIHLPHLDARSLGELFVFFELSVALMGELLDVNAFDQPGVELMKKVLKEKR